MNEEKNLNSEPIEVLNPNEILENNGAILTETLEQEEIEELLFEKPKSKGNLFGLILLGIILASVLLLVLGYFLIFNKPKNIFLKAINTEYKNFMSIFNNQFDYLDINYKEDKVLSEGTLDYNVTLADEVLNEYPEEDDALIRDAIKDINALNYKVSSSIDYKNKEFVAQLSVDGKNENIIDLNVYALQERMYLELKNLFDKVIELPEFDYDILYEENVLDIEDLEYILEQIKNSFLNNLVDDDFSSIKSELEIDGKLEKLKKVTYKITSETVTALVENMLNDLKDNEEFIEALMRVTKQERSVINNAINSMLDMVKVKENTTKESSEYMEISVYTKGLMNEVVAYEILDKTKYSEEIIRIIKGEVTNFQVIYDGEEVFTALIEFPSNNLINITAKQDTSEFTLNIEYSANEYKMNYAFSEEEGKFYGKASLKKEEVTQDKVYNTNYSFEFAIDIDGIQEFMKVDCNMNIKTEVGKSLTVPEISNKVALEDMTDADLEQIMTKLMENEFFQKYIVTSTTDSY